MPGGCLFVRSPAPTGSIHTPLKFVFRSLFSDNISVAVFDAAPSRRQGAHLQFHFATVGVNWYIAGEAARLTLDGVLSLSDTSGLAAAGTLPDTAVGLLGDTEENEVVIRAQLQLMF